MFFYKIFPCLLFLSFLLVSCSEESNKSTKKDLDTLKDNIAETIDSVSAKIIPGDTIFENVKVINVQLKNNSSEKLTEKLEEFFDVYIDMKDDLAENDSADVKEDALKALDLIRKYSKDTAVTLNKKWILTEKKESELRNKIENATSLDEQREWFSKLSQSLSETILEYGLPGNLIYELSSTSSKLPYKNWFTDSKDTDDPYSENGDEEDSVIVVNAWEFKDK